MADVLVTGASGVLGRPLVAALLAEGHAVRAVSRRPQVAGRLQWYRADVATGQGLAEAARGVDAVVHCATHPFRTEAVDLEGLRRLRAAAPDARIVYPSIVGVDGVRFPITASSWRARRPWRARRMPSCGSRSSTSSRTSWPRCRCPWCPRASARSRSRRPRPRARWPGSAGFRKGLNLCPERRVGRQRWDEHFEAWQAAGRPDLARGGMEEGGRVGALRSP